LRGPEGKNVISNLTESELRAFFQLVAGWHLVFQNVDVRIGYNLPLPMEGYEEKDRGIDFLFAAFNPFTGRKEGILVETKHVRERQAVYASRLQEYVDEPVIAPCDSTILAIYRIRNPSILGACL
jgi:hypothetical protein